MSLLHATGKKSGPEIFAALLIWPWFSLFQLSNWSLTLHKISIISNEVPFALVVNQWVLHTRGSRKVSKKLEDTVYTLYVGLMADWRIVLLRLVITRERRRIIPM